MPVQDVPEPIIKHHLHMLVSKVYTGSTFTGLKNDQASSMTKPF